MRAKTGEGQGMVDLNIPASRVRALIEGIFRPVTAIGASFKSTRQSCLTVGAAVTPERLSSGIREIVWHQLSLLPAADGAGVVAAPGVVEDKERHLEWWQRTASGDDDPDGFARIRLNLDPDSIDLYDYLDMDWYTVPRLAGRRHVYGPYIDFSGADRYVLTLTVPVYGLPAPAGVAASVTPPPRQPAEPVFLGVAGAHIRMSHLEPELLAILRSVPAAAVLVTEEERRVVAANTPRWISGTRLDRLPAPGADGFAAVAAIGADSGWLLAAAAPNPNQPQP